ncbi:MAG: transaldolase family protein [Anaerolineaceae bacterium]
MNTVNYLTGGEGGVKTQFALGALNASIISNDEPYVNRVKDLLLPSQEFNLLSGNVKHIGVTERFRDVIKTFDVPSDETPAGFRVESTLCSDGLLTVDLVRDISYDKNGVKRPTGFLFSADSANPYEVAPIAPLIGNLTCNPGIIYDLFIHNPEANIGNKFTTRDEVIAEIGRILGPGCDISVELNNPFERDFDKILAECEKFKEMLTEYRLVIKVPFTGPVNADNVNELLANDKRLSTRYDQPATKDAFLGHNLALKLREHGYRINFTLMFEPYQTAMALQAKPYFINSFVRQRLHQTTSIKKFLDFYELTDDTKYLEEIRNVMLANDYLSKNEKDTNLFSVLKLAKDIVRYRNIGNPFGEDGLDSVRHDLRLIRNLNLPDTRLIICSMEGEYMYPDIDNLLADPEYADVIDRLVITAEPSYLARFSSANQVVSYQRRFMNAANGEK